LETQDKHIEIEEEGINLLELWQNIKKQKYLIFLLVFIFSALGVMIALSTPNEYSSEVKLLPELDSKDGAGGLSKFKSLAGLAGVDLSSVNSTEAIRPDLYPNILQSTPFLLEVLNQKVFVPKEKNTQILAGYLEKHNDTFWKRLMKKIASDEIASSSNSNTPSDAIKLTKVQEELVRDLQGRVGASLDKKSGVISISAKMPNPVASAMIVTFTQKYITDYVTRYRTEKTLKEVAFLEKRSTEAKRRYDNALFNVSSYNDQNRSIFLNVAKDEGKKLDNELQLSYNLYSEITRQLEEAKIKMSRETPIFKVLEPAQVPLKKSEPKRSVMVIGFAFLGLFLGMGYAIIKGLDFKKLLS
jgi:uncharacterized protein involved in exopolysaccharide biosynthesis